MADRNRVVITGASSGIGRATAVRFAQAGYDVCLNARREGQLHELSASLPDGDHLVCAGDYSDQAAVAAMGETIGSRWGRVDALVNSAGVCEAADIIDAPLEEWRRPIDVFVNGSALVTRMAVPLMAQGGRIIHITSIHGRRVEPGYSAYAIAKAALDQYCRALAIDLASKGILANAIAPGFIDTPMSVVADGTNELETEWFRQNYVEGNHLPLRRPGRAEEVAGVALFLAGPDASYITGQVIAVDGGLSITF